MRSALVLAPLAAALAACTPAAPVPAPGPSPAAAPVSYALASRAALRDSIDAAVGAPEFRSAHWGILIVDPGSGDTLYSRNAGKLFMPASNQKLITGAVALARLGPDYRYRTAFVAGGPVRDSVLEGDLLVLAHGDPTISDAMRGGDAMAPLREVADALWSRGIRRIAGVLRSGRDAFPDSPYGFGWAYDDFDYPYSAGVDELFFNEGLATVTVHGDAIGSRARVVVRPAQGALTVRPPEVVAIRDTARPVRFDLVDGLEQRSARSDVDVVVTGVLAVGDSARASFAFPDQQAAYLAALGAALAERGIGVGSATRTPGEPEPATPSGDTLHVLVSPPLRDILPVFEKPSQNQIGEILLKTLAYDSLGVGTAGAGRRIVERQLLAWGADSLGFAVRDGSGLSRHNYVTPETLVRVLDAMRRSRDFRVYYDALPIAGVDGTIRNRMRGTPAAGNVRAKTGTIDKARALSGYVTTADGRLLLFSTVANNHTVPTARVDRVQNLIGAWLAGSRASDLGVR